MGGGFDLEQLAAIVEEAEWKRVYEVEMASWPRAGRNVPGADQIR